MQTAVGLIVILQCPIYSPGERLWMFNMATDEVRDDRAFSKKLLRDLRELEEWRLFYKDVIKSQRTELKRLERIVKAHTSEC